MKDNDRYEKKSFIKKLLVNQKKIILIYRLDFNTHRFANTIIRKFGWINMSPVPSPPCSIDFVILLPSDNCMTPSSTNPFKTTTVSVGALSCSKKLTLKRKKLTFMIYSSKQWVKVSKY